MLEQIVVACANNFSCRPTRSLPRPVRSATHELFQIALPSWFMVYTTMTLLRQRPVATCRKLPVQLEHNFAVQLQLFLQVLRELVRRQESSADREGEPGSLAARTRARRFVHRHSRRVSRFCWAHQLPVLVRNNKYSGTQLLPQVRQWSQ